MNAILEWLLGISGGDLAGGNEWRLDVIGEYNNYVKLAMLLALVAMICLTIRSYRREGDARKGVKSFLAALRIAIIVLVFVIFLRPTVVLRFTRTIYSSVAVLLDDSMSMGFVDRDVHNGDGDRLAGKLGVKTDELAAMSRKDIVCKEFQSAGSVLEKLATDHPLDLMRFSTDQPGRESYTRRLGPTVEDFLAVDRPKPLATSGPANIDAMLAKLEAKGHETNLSAALRDAIDSLAGKRGCIVLVSDGRGTSQDQHSAMEGARDYAAKSGLAIYTVTVGDPTPPRNVSVVGLQGPSDTWQDASAQFIAKIAHRGLTGESVTVKLQRRESESKEDWEDLTSKTVVMGNDSDSPDKALSHGDQQVELDAKLDNEVGSYIFRAFIEPRGDEQNVQDNWADMTVRVTDKQIKVLLLSGDAGHEFQYLKSYLLSQPEVYKLSVWQQNADPDVNQAASTGMKLTEFPHSLEALMGSKDGKFPGYDVIIAYDPLPTGKGFDGEFAANLKAAVDTHGVGLCYIAGNKHSALMLGTKSEEFQPLQDLMPVMLGRADLPNWISDKKPDPWPVLVTGYGIEHPIMHLGETTDQSQRLWENLPGIFWSHSLLRVKPLARVLAENSNPARRLDRSTPEPLIVVQPVGRGRVAYMDFDETWRWRAVEDARYYRAFWSNVVKYLTPSTARQVLITTGGERFSAGAKIDVEVEAYDDEYRPLKDPRFTLLLVDKDTGASTPVSLDALADKDKPGRYKGVIPAAQASRVGVYELTAGRGDGDKVQRKEIRIELPQAEYAQPQADPVNMQNIATRPEYALKIADADKLAELIPPGKLVAWREVQRELWDSKITLILIVTLLTAEWVLRKKYNMT